MKNKLKNKIGSGISLLLVMALVLSFNTVSAAAEEQPADPGTGAEVLTDGSGIDITDESVYDTAEGSAADMEDETGDLGSEDAQGTEKEEAGDFENEDIADEDIPDEELLTEPEEIPAAEEEEGFVAGAQAELYEKYDIVVGDDTFTYEVTGIGEEGSGTRTVTLCAVSHAGTAPSDVVIPEAITLDDGDYAVTAIADGVFSASDFETGDPLLKSISLPGTIEEIGPYAFNKCLNLETVSIGSGIKTIDAYAFNGCTGIKTLFIPATVMTIGKGAFDGCSALSSLTFEEGLQTIGVLAFHGCIGLTAVNIPDSVTKIDTRAFDNCTELKTATLGSGLKTLGTGAFQECANLESASIPDSVTTLGTHVFNKCRKLAVMTIGTGVTAIGSTTFQCCESLKTVTVPDGVTSIGDWAFYGCTGLEELNLPDSVKTVGKLAFYDCGKITSLTLPGQLTSIGESAFRSCTGLTGTLTIPDLVTLVGKYAFQECSGILNVAFGSSVRTIGNGAFYKCAGLASLTLPDSLTSVGGQAFDGCTGLSGQTLELPVSLTSAYNQSFGNRYFAKIINNSDKAFNHYSFLRPAEVSEYFYVDENGVITESLGKGTYVLSKDGLTQIDVPAGKTLTYTGSAQTGVDDGTGYTLSGTVSATDAGSYEATATLNEKYIWADGTTEAKTISWKIDKAGVKVTVPAGNTFTYNGKTRTGVSAGSEYTLSGTYKAKNAGKYTAKAALKTDTNYEYSWSDGTTAEKSITWKINKAANPMKIKAKTASVKYSNLTAKDRSFAVGKILSFTKKGQGTKSYTLSSAKKGSKSFKKYFSIAKKTGKLTVKKGLGEGTYKVKIKVKAAGNNNYKSATKEITVTVKVN